MPRLRSRLLGAAAAAGLACAGLVAGAGPAAAAACSGTSGVTVVIDTGSSVSTRCAGGDPASALSALSSVATVTQVQTQPGFVCRIDGYPASDCVRTPPASAYWAFFHAPRGGAWTYSSQGAASYDPPAGSVIGFRFGSGQQPRTAPPAPSPTAAPAPATTAPEPTTETPRATSASGPTTSAPRTSSPGSGAGSTESAGAATEAGTPEAGRTRSARPTKSQSTSAGTGDPTATAAGAVPASPTTLAAEPASADGSGEPTTLLVAGALLALLGGGAGWFAWRRRSP